MAQTDRRVVLTGAAGRIGTAITPALSRRWDLRLTDVEAGHGIDALDITDSGACRAAFVSADAVVHLAAVPDPDATWEQLLPANVIGAYHVAGAAAACGVRRLVLTACMSCRQGRTRPRSASATRPDQAISTVRLKRGPKQWEPGWRQRHRPLS